MDSDAPDSFPRPASSRFHPSEAAIMAGFERIRENYDAFVHHDTEGQITALREAYLAIRTYDLLFQAV